MYPGRAAGTVLGSEVGLAHRTCATLPLSPRLTGGVNPAIWLWATGFPHVYRPIADYLHSGHLSAVAGHHRMVERRRPGVVSPLPDVAAADRVVLLDWQEPRLRWD